MKRSTSSSPPLARASEARPLQSLAVRAASRLRFAVAALAILAVPAFVPSLARAQTIRIDQPDVTHAQTDMPSIAFQPGDKVTLSADGCVQTGGSGATWKRYVNPSGANSDRLYHGLVGIHGLNGSDQLPLQRFLGINGQTFRVATASFLRLGYEDDGYGDNGYWGHDNGTEDQCSGAHGYGGDAYVNVTIQPNGAPVAMFTTSTSGAVATFANNSSDPDGDSLSYAWTFGDGGTSTQASPSHTYAPGTYNLCLTVTDPYGAKASTCQTLSIIKPGGTSLGTPGGLAVSGATQTSISVVWTTSSGATSYDVYRDDALVANQAGTGYTFSGLHCGENHTLRVIARNSAGPSAPASIPASTSACPSNGNVVNGGTAATLSVSNATFQASWKQSRLTGSLLLAGSTSQAAQLQLTLSPSAGGSPVSLQLSVPGGSFTKSLSLPASLLPGDYQLNVSGKSGASTLPEQQRSLTLQAPPEGVVARAFISGEKNGPPATQLLGKRTQIWANFEFAPGSKPIRGAITTTWYRPGGKLVGKAGKPNLQTVSSSIRESAGLKKGHWRCVLKVGGVTVASAVVQVA